MLLPFCQNSKIGKVKRASTLKSEWIAPKSTSVTGSNVTLDRATQAVQVVKNPPANAGDARDTGSIPGTGRCPGGGHGNSPQYSGLERKLCPWTEVTGSYSSQGRRESDIPEAT